MSQLEDIWARLVARAWVDPDFKSQLISNPKEILKENKYQAEDPNESYQVLENNENLMNIVISFSKEKNHPKNEELNRRWSVLINDMKSNSSLKQELISKPSETLKKYDIPVPLYPVKIHFETKTQKYLVLPLPPREELSETQLQRIFAGLSITNDFSSDTSCG